MSGLKPSAPFGTGSISLGLHVDGDGPARLQVERLVDLARLAEDVGFDGVTVSEHHVGFPGYLPQPLLAANWLLAATRTAWAAPAPLLVGLRNPRLVAEEVAWTAARHPGRLGVAVAPGYARDDFEAVGAPFDDRIARSRAAIGVLVEELRGEGRLASDPAIAGLDPNAVPVLGGANSTAGVEALARLGVGLIFPGGEEPARLGELARHFRREGGAGPVVWIRHLWVGTRPDTPAARSASSHFRQAAASGMRQAGGFHDLGGSGDPGEVASRLRDDLALVGASAINVRVHVAGVAPAVIRHQVREVGAMLATVRDSLPWPE